MLNSESVFAAAVSKCEIAASTALSKVMIRECCANWRSGSIVEQAHALRAQTVYNGRSMEEAKLDSLGALYNAAERATGVDIFWQRKKVKTPIILETQVSISDRDVAYAVMHAGEPSLDRSVLEYLYAVSRMYKIRKGGSHYTAFEKVFKVLSTSIATYEQSTGVPHPFVFALMDLERFAPALFSIVQEASQRASDQSGSESRIFDYMKRLRQADLALKLSVDSEGTKILSSHIGELNGEIDGLTQNILYTRRTRNYFALGFVLITLIEMCR
jgi:hypothetical protein